MAEITTTRTETRKQSSGSSEPTVTVTECTTVRSLRTTRGFDVSILADLMDALTDAGVPADAAIEHRTLNGLLSGLIVRWETVERHGATESAWDRGDPEPPADVTKLNDKDGDTWTRRGSAWQCGDAGDPCEWSVVVSYGPLTEVLP